jgi:hypothetical protein
MKTSLCAAVVLRPVRPLRKGKLFRRRAKRKPVPLRKKRTFLKWFFRPAECRFTLHVLAGCFRVVSGVLPLAACIFIEIERESSLRKASYP